MSVSKNNNILGQRSYAGILGNINSKIMESKADTLLGNELLSECYKKLNESATPVMELKAFTTKAEKVAPDDATLKEIIDFCRKQVTTGDFNFLLNFIKEEKIDTARRSFHPDPASILKEFDEYTTAPSSVIEQAIKKGLLDGMESNLLNKIKCDLTGTKQAKPLNESADYLQKGNIVRYSPIGIQLQDVPNNRILLLLESDVLSFDNKSKEIKPLFESEIAGLEIPANYRKLMHAINSLSYDPKTSSFNLSENWDFDLQLRKNGTITIDGKPIPKEEISKLLLESVNLYKSVPNKVKGFNNTNYLRDADNFILLSENCAKLVKFDNLETFVNLSENKYIIFDKESLFSEPSFLTSSKGHKLFESFNDLCLDCKEILGSDLVELFESQLKDEKFKIEERNSKLVNLNETQQNLSAAIVKVQNLKKMAEINSPAFNKLSDQENKLDINLNECLDELNFYKNEFKLH